MAGESYESRKKSHEPEDHADQTGSEVALSLSIQNMSKYLGVGGLCSNKKRKIETSIGKLHVFDEDWLDLDKVKNLSPEQRKSYTEQMSSKTLHHLVLLKKLLAFFHKWHSNGRKPVKDIIMDTLLKDLKTNPSLPVPERYSEMGLWTQVMQVNQRLWKTMTTLEGEGEDSASNVESEESKKVADAEKESKTFRDYYIEMMTSSFADDLDRLRKDDNLDKKQIGVLIDFLETGQDIWSGVEKQLLQSTFIT